MKRFKYGADLTFSATVWIEAEDRDSADQLFDDGCVQDYELHTAAPCMYQRWGKAEEVE